MSVQTTQSTPSSAEAANRAPAKPHAGTALSRGVALFLGFFSLLQLVIQLRHPHYDANLWWIDLFPLPRVAPLVAQSALLFVAMTWLGYAFVPNLSDWRRRTTTTAIELLWLFLAWNVLNFYAGLFRGTFHTAFPVPFSFFVAIALACVWRGARSERPARGPMAWGIMTVAFLLLAGLFPLLQMFCYGLIDYRRPADVAVVFGARVYEKGVPSDAVADRVHLAADLYKNQLVSRLIVSGGPADGGQTSETDAMRKLAIAAGVPFEEIRVDPQGVNTNATVHNVTPLLHKIQDELPDRREPTILAVSHFYHLPRIKMAFELEERDVRTVPARQPLTQMPKLLLREIAATWKFYFESFLK